MNFPYMKTEAEIQEFGKWIKDLGIKEISGWYSTLEAYGKVLTCLLDWWAHKVNNKWILPSIIQCVSKISPEDWVITEATTNIGESQHHWTNKHTGMRLSLVEAIVT